MQFVIDTPVAVNVTTLLKKIFNNTYFVLIISKL
jgi:hypothetical protein